MFVFIFQPGHDSVMKAEWRVINHDVALFLDCRAFGAVEGTVAGQSGDGYLPTIVVVPPRSISTVKASRGVMLKTEFVEVRGKVSDELGLPVVGEG